MFSFENAMHRETSLEAGGTDGRPRSELETANPPLALFELRRSSLELLAAWDWQLDQVPVRDWRVMAGMLSRLPAASIM
jgi:hypothetical protein